MATNHGFCSLHRIGYDRRLDATCPQCLIGHVTGAAQLDYGPVTRQAAITDQVPIDPATNKPLDPVTLQPAP